MTIRIEQSWATNEPEPAGMHWYAAYTCPRHEKWVLRQLEERRVDSFVPLYRTVHQWKDRRKVLELALFPSYVFVRIDAAERLSVLQVPGVVHLVSFNGRPAPLPHSEITALRNGSNQRFHMEPCEYLQGGDRVRIVGGPLLGATGIVARFKSKVRVVITLEVLMRSIAVEVGAEDIEALVS